MQYKSMDEANQAVIQHIIESQPFLLDVVPANSVISELDDKALLHAGPPTTWDKMPHTMQGSCIGATLFEGWADNEDDAKKMLVAGEIKFMSAQTVYTVCTQCGIYSSNMT